MEVYCVKEKRFTPNVPGSEKTVTTKNGRKMLKVKCASCGITKTRFLPNKQGSGVGPVQAAKTMYELPQKLFPWTKKTFDDYWSGKIVKNAFNSKDGFFTKNFWDGDYNRKLLQRKFAKK